MLSARRELMQAPPSYGKFHLTYRVEAQMSWPTMKSKVCPNIRSSSFKVFC